MLAELVVILLVEEVVFYYSHWILHHRRFLLIGGDNYGDNDRDDEGRLLVSPSWKVTVLILGQ